MKELFAGDLSKPKFNSFDDGANLIMVRSTAAAKATDLNAQAKTASDEAGLKNALARKMMDNILKELEANTKVKINHNVLQM